MAPPAPSPSTACPRTPHIADLAAPTPQAERARRHVLLAAMLAGSVAGWDATAVYFIFPDIRDGLADGDGTAASWVLSITSIVGAAVVLQAGRLADRLGHRAAYHGGSFVYAVGSLAATVAPGLWILVTARALMAVGLAVMGPTSMALILRATPPSKHGAALGRWGAYTAVAGVAGPIVVAALIDSVSWRLAFAVQVPAALGLAWLTHRPAGIDDPDERVRFSLGDSLLTVAALALMVLPLVEGNDWGWTSPRVVGCFLAAVMMLGAVVLRSTRDPSPPLPLDLFTRRSFAIGVAMSVSSGAMFFAQWLVYLLFITEIWGIDLIEAALVLTVMPATMMLIAVPIGRATPRVGFRAVLAPGAAIYTVTAAMFWLGAGRETNMVLLVIALVGAGVGMATVWPTLVNVANHDVEPHRFGTSSATIQTVQRFGGALGIALTVAILAGGGDRLTRHLSSVALLTVAGAATTALALWVPGGRGDGRDQAPVR